MMRPSFLVCLPLLVVACIDDTRNPIDTSAPDDTDTIDNDAESCTENGTTRCAENANATESCSDSLWHRAACADDKICVNTGGAQCVDSTGDADCHDTFYCFLGCQLLHPDPEDQDAANLCAVQCYTAGTQQAQRELSNVIDCFNTRCGEGAGLDCIHEHCTQDLADCYYDTTGDRGCGAIVTCRLACGEADPTCIKGCGTDSTVDAQGDYALLELCTYYACYGQGEDCVRQVDGANGACAFYASECIGLLPSTPR